MGRRGPQKTPTATLALRGSWLAKTRPDQAPIDAGIPDPPPWLREDAREEWNYVASLLAASGVLTRRDRNALAMYCHAVADLLAAERDIAENGIDQASEGGLVIQRPSVSRRNKAHEQVRQWGAQFGLSPSTRAGVKETGKETKDKGKARFFERTA